MTTIIINLGIGMEHKCTESHNMCRPICTQARTYVSVAYSHSSSYKKAAVYAS